MLADRTFIDSLPELRRYSDFPSRTKLESKGAGGTTDLSVTIGESESSDLESVLTVTLAAAP
jgi:hypothetical protein